MRMVRIILSTKACLCFFSSRFCRLGYLATSGSSGWGPLSVWPTVERRVHGLP